jgi:DNA-binding NarL/FixJ family response regulator
MGPHPPNRGSRPLIACSNVNSTHLLRGCVVKRNAHAMLMASDPHHGFSTLSNRERQVAALIALGHPNKYIGHKLGITEGTVKAHAHAIFQKLGVRTRYELASKFAALQAFHRGGKHH